MKKVQFVGLDVHADTIAVAVAEPDGDGAVGGGDSESPGIDPYTGEAPWIPRTVARVLRGGPHRVCPLLAADGPRCAMRGRRAHLGPGEGRRPCQDGSARRPETGTELPRGRPDAGVGP